MKRGVEIGVVLVYKVASRRANVGAIKDTKDKKKEPAIRGRGEIHIRQRRVKKRSKVVKMAVSRGKKVVQFQNGISQK